MQARWAGPSTHSGRTDVGRGCEPPEMRAPHPQSPGGAKELGGGRILSPRRGSAPGGASGSGGLRTPVATATRLRRANFSSARRA